MTIGYPDYNRQTHAASVDVLSFSQKLTGSVDSAFVYCGDFPYLDFSIRGGDIANWYTIEVLLFDDSAGANQTFDTTFVIYGSKVQAIQIPTIGKYVKFGVTPYHITDLNNTNIYVRGSMWPHHNSWQMQGAIPLIRTNPTLTAGSTNLQGTPVVAFGPATLHIEAVSNLSWHSDVTYFDNVLGSYQTFLRFQSAFNGQYVLERISLPAAPVRISTTNDDSASSNTFFISLTAG